MRKIIITILSCILITPLWAAQSQIHGLLPMTNQTSIIQPTPSLQKTPLLSAAFVKAGGFGGNERIGKLIYSNDPNTLPALTVSREFSTGICYLTNQNSIIKNIKTKQIISFDCVDKDPNYDLYWDADLGTVNGGYSPENDALYAVDVVTNMFNEWYGIPPVSDENGIQIPITIYLHVDMANAYWGLKNKEIYLGDGKSQYYPLTTLNVISFMIGGLFTNQHVSFDWSDEAGGIDVAFDCMTAMAAEYYATGTNTWQIGADTAKNGQALQYMDKPSKDCHGKQKPGDYCSIDTLAEYRRHLDPHYSSGLFNRAFYLLAHTNGWNTRKAYDVFVQANRFHWKKYDTSFYEGACGVVASTKELGYDKMAVMKAFAGVGIDTRDC